MKISPIDRKISLGVIKNTPKVIIFRLKSARFQKKNVFLQKKSIRIMKITEQDREFMREAIRLASESVRNGGGPFGAVVVKDGEIIAGSSNSVTIDLDPTVRPAANWAPSTFRAAPSTPRASPVPCVSVPSTGPTSTASIMATPARMPVPSTSPTISSTTRWTSRSTSAPCPSSPCCATRPCSPFVSGQRRPTRPSIKCSKCSKCTLFWVTI